MMATEVQAKAARWYTVRDDIIGGWAVATANKLVGDLDWNNGELVVADVFSEEMGKYLCSLHNVKTWFEA